MPNLVGYPAPGFAAPYRPAEAGLAAMKLEEMAAEKRDATPSSSENEEEEEEDGDAEAADYPSVGFGAGWLPSAAPILRPSAPSLGGLALLHDLAEISAERMRVAAERF